MECSIFDVYKDDSISNDSVLTNINDVHYALELLGRHAEESEYNFGEFMNEYEVFVNKEESRWANALGPEDALELQRILNNHSVEAVDINNNLVHYYNKIPVIYISDITDEEGEVVELYQDYNGTYLFVSNVPNIACELGMRKPTKHQNIACSLSTHATSMRIISWMPSLSMMTALKMKTI